MLLGLIVSYLSSISFFYHSHDTGNTIVTHSHPHHTDSNGNTKHSHSKSELQSIQDLSIVETADIAIPVLTFDFLALYAITLSQKNYQQIIYISLKENFRLRPPPASFL